MNVSSVIPVPVPKILFVEVNTRVYRHDRILFLTNIGGSIKIKFLNILDTSWKRAWHLEEGTMIFRGSSNWMTVRTAKSLVFLLQAFVFKNRFTS